MRKRFLSWLLCAALMLTMFPGAPVRAAEGENLPFEPLDVGSGDLNLPAPELPWSPETDITHDHPPGGEKCPAGRCRGGF